jgi:ABC-type amino acid transport substrate-binding protein
MRNSWHVSAKTLALGLALGCVASAFSQSKDSHLDRVVATKRLRVCIWPAYFGISYRNPKTQRVEGVDSDLAQELAKDLGATLEFVDSSYAKLISDVTTDRCDVAMFGIGITPDRAAKLRFVSPTLSSDIFALTTRSNRRIKSWGDIDKSGVVVSVMRGTLSEGVMREQLKLASLSVVDSPAAREQEVTSGRSDVLMSDYPYVQHILETSDWARAITPEHALRETPYAYAIAYGDDTWAQRLEQFVSDIKRDCWPRSIQIF